jgi:large subunit ribosomal protein L20
MNAAARLYGLNYSELLHSLKKANMLLNRKMLAQLAIRDQEAFGQLVQSLN